MALRRGLRVAAIFSLGASWIVACGSRTELLAPEIPDAALDAKVDVRDAAHDVAEEDVAEEDVAPIPDAFPDVPIVSDCPDAGSTFIYLLGEQNELYSFYPPTLTFASIGTVACSKSASPYSMAVTRSGIAFSVFTDGHLFEVSTANAACKATPFVPGQNGFVTSFGMGFASTADGGESLYVVGTGVTQSSGLATIDTTTFALDVVGDPPLPSRCELTGTGDGRLFAYCVPMFGTGATLAEIDPLTAQVLSTHALAGNANEAFAFAFWGGDFWIFTAPNNVGSTVTEYDPVAQTETDVTTAPLTIVGAGVSTCAPQQ
jgi:hypothetical protein